MKLNFIIVLIVVLIAFVINEITYRITETEKTFYSPWEYFKLLPLYLEKKKKEYLILFIINIIFSLLVWLCGPLYFLFLI